MTRELEISNFILSLSERMALNEKDLVFAYEQFIESEEYEKCSVINSRKTDNNKDEYIGLYLKIQDEKKTINKLIEDLNELFEDSNTYSVKLIANNMLLSLNDSENRFWGFVSNEKIIYSLIGSGAIFK